MTVKEVAEMAGVSVQSVRAWASKSNIQKLSNNKGQPAYFITEEQAEQLIAYYKDGRGEFAYTEEPAEASEASRSSEDMEGSITEAEARAEEIEGLKSTIDGLLEELRDQEAEARKANHEALRLEGELDNANTQIKDITEELEKARAEISSLKEQNIDLTAKNDLLYMQNNFLSSDQSKERHIEDLQGQIKTLTEQITQKDEQIAQLSEALDNAQKLQAMTLQRFPSDDEEPPAQIKKGFFAALIEKIRGE